MSGTFFFSLLFIICLTVHGQFTLSTKTITVGFQFEIDSWCLKPWNYDYSKLLSCNLFPKKGHKIRLCLCFKSPSIPCYGNVCEQRTLDDTNRKLKQIYILHWSCLFFNTSSFYSQVLHLFTLINTQKYKIVNL